MAVSAAAPAPRDRETALTKDDRLDLRVWFRLLTCATLIERSVRQGLREEFGITLPKFDLLSQLDRAEEGLTMGELSRRLMVTNGNVTGLIDRLVTEGLVARQPAAASAAAMGECEKVGRATTATSTPSIAALRSVVISAGFATPSPSLPS